jgi:hypothetical protein
VPVVVYTGALGEGLAMKVTRLKDGFRIDVSDDEMGMLGKIVLGGIPSKIDDEDDDDFLGWSPQEKALLARRLMKVGSGDPSDFLKVDKDDRAA